MARRTRPAAATFVAVINILLGIPCLCCSGCVSGGQILGMATGNQGEEELDAPDDPNDPIGSAIKNMARQEEFIAKEVKHEMVLTLIVNIGSLIASLILLVSGFMLLTGHSSGWLAAILGLLILLGCTTVEVINNVVFVMPAAKKFDVQEEQAERKKADEISSTSALMINIALKSAIGIAYPILALILLMTGPVRAFYAQRTSDEHDRYQDDDEYDRPRRRRYDEDDYDRPRRSDDDDDPRFR